MQRERHPLVELLETLIRMFECPFLRISSLDMGEQVKETALEYFGQKIMDHGALGFKCRY